MSWSELNCTLHFTHFRREVDQYTGSLGILLYNKEKVVDVLLRHLEVPNSLALEPLLKYESIGVYLGGEAVPRLTWAYLVVPAL